MKPIVAEVREAETADVLVNRAKKLAKQADGMSWQLADIYVQLKSKGWTVRKIAEECEHNKDSISRFIRCVESCIPRDTRPPFWEVYREIKDPKSNGAAEASWSIDDDISRFGKLFEKCRERWTSEGHKAAMKQFFHQLANGV